MTDTNGQAPFYLPIGDEVDIFRAAYECRLPVLLKGPTGCGKTRFVEYMAHMLMREEKEEVPGNLITVACHEDLTGSDLVGRYLIQGDETVWIDGPLTQAVRLGTVCYLDEIVEARKDTIVLIHPLTDHRRILPIDKKGEIQQAHSDFLLVISYNPGYQSILKDLKHSTRQRFVTIEFTYPPRDKEAEVIAHESTLELETALDLARLAAGPFLKAEQYRDARDRFIASHADILGGTPVIDGTRITVYAVLGRFQGGDTIEELLEDYPRVPVEAFQAAELYAKAHPLRGRPSGRPWRNDA